MPVHSLLITGPEEARSMFHLRVCNVLNLIEGRGDTIRYTCFSEDLPKAMKAAQEDDVTVQEIENVGSQEIYPVRHMGSHRLTWEKPKVEPRHQ